MDYAICPHCQAKLPINSMKACTCTCEHKKPKGAAVCDDCIMDAINSANAARTGAEIVPGATRSVQLSNKEIRSLNVVLRNAR